MEKKSMADKWDEITQLEAAYDALKSQPRDAQVRMLEWLNSRLAADYAQAMEDRKEAIRKRAADSAGAEGK
jgi:hypothetical protein